jgi:exodeoxyribonuclease VII small subunit
MQPIKLARKSYTNTNLSPALIPEAPFMAKKKINFEESLSELETLVEEMEQGNLSLEESLSRFEKGISLTTECQQALQSAELKVQELVEKNGKILEKDFDLKD